MNVPLPFAAGLRPGNAKLCEIGLYIPTGTLHHVCGVRTERYLRSLLACVAIAGETAEQ
jgi:hypothetical protein